MLDGFLSVGGREVVNSARSYGYASTSDCPALWLVNPECESLADALAEPGYSFDNVDQAPWFDPDRPDVSRRFLGVYGIMLDGSRDSTRTAEMTELAGSGGRIGGRRHASRQVRVQAWLTAAGRDALEYGMGWLAAAVSADSCGLHNSMCGVTDVSFFTDCPPSYADSFGVPADRVFVQSSPPPMMDRMDEVLWVDTSAARRVVKQWRGQGSPGVDTSSIVMDGFVVVNTYIGVQPVVVPAGGVTLTVVGSVVAAASTAGLTATMGGVVWTASVDGDTYRASAAGSVVLSEGTWSLVTLTDTPYEGDAFDGDTPGAWWGAGGWTVVDDTKYNQAITDRQRYIHDTDCISGPFTVMERESSDGIHIGRLVEFTLGAEDAYVYAAPREVGLLPSLPSVVQDTLYNLLPTPSMELTDGSSIVVSTNYSLNPSVETNATGWTAFTIGITPVATGARSTELAAAGVASFKSSVVATNSGTDGQVFAYQEVSLAGVPSSARVSIGMWATLVRVAGTAVLGTIDMGIEWCDSGGALILYTPIGSEPATGGPLSLTSLRPPAGAVMARVIASGNVTSWSVGASLALYADALSVTVP